MSSRRTPGTEGGFGQLLQCRQRHASRRRRRAHRSPRVRHCQKQFRSGSVDMLDRVRLPWNDFGPDAALASSSVAAAPSQVSCSTGRASPGKESVSCTRVSHQKQRGVKRTRFPCLPRNRKRQTRATTGPVKSNSILIIL